MFSESRSLLSSIHHLSTLFEFGHSLLHYKTWGTPYIPTASHKLHISDHLPLFHEEKAVRSIIQYEEIRS